MTIKNNTVYRTKFEKILKIQTDNCTSKIGNKINSETLANLRARKRSETKGVSPLAEAFVQT
jgi:hypothetical protein